MSCNKSALRIALADAIDRLEFARHCAIQDRRHGNDPDQAYRAEKKITDALVALHWLVSDMNGLTPRE